jgi:hypothetical protein
MWWFKTFRVLTAENSIQFQVVTIIKWCVLHLNPVEFSQKYANWAFQLVLTIFQKEKSGEILQVGFVVLLFQSRPFGTIFYIYTVIVDHQIQFMKKTIAIVLMILIGFYFSLLLLLHV